MRGTEINLFQHLCEPKSANSGHQSLPSGNKLLCVYFWAVFKLTMGQIEMWMLLHPGGKSSLQSEILGENGK